MSSRWMLAILCAAVCLAACLTPEPEPPPDDDDAVDDDDVAPDDDDSAVDDDDSVLDDDDVTEEPTPEPLPVLTPAGADVGVPGTMVGLRATGEWEALLWTSNQVEVSLVVPPPDGAPPPPGPPETLDADLVAFDQYLKASLAPVLEAAR